jgi:di/tricarboxylate transporter
MLMITVEQGLFLGIVVAALALFVHGRLRVDVIALLTLLALVVIGVLTPGEALAGFSSEPAIIVASVFVLSAGLSATGVTDRIGVWIGRAAGASEWRALLVIMPTVALFAAVSHHLMVTAMMLPIVLRLARDHKLPASRLLMRKRSNNRTLLKMGSLVHARDQSKRGAGWRRSGGS